MLAGSGRTKCLPAEGGSPRVANCEQLERKASVRMALEFSHLPRDWLSVWPFVPGAGATYGPNESCLIKKAPKKNICSAVFVRSNQWQSSSSNSTSTLLLLLEIPRFSFNGDDEAKMTTQRRGTIN